MSQRPRVYVDSCVLIAACRGKDPIVAMRAVQELDRDDVDFLFSSIVKLETIPGPARNAFPEQLQFYNDFFADAIEIPCDAAVQADALHQACSGGGLAAADALHVACARAGGATVLVTAEGMEKPLPQATGIQVRTIRY